MEYILMHKSIPVLTMFLDEETSVVQKIGSVYNSEHLPIGTQGKKELVNRAALNAWWIDRSIPASRSGVRHALETLNLQTPQMLLTRCFGLSLSDQYWVRPTNRDLKWEDVNFFDNPFSEDIGDILLGKNVETEQFNFQSPDNTSDGYLKKRWKVVNGKRCLIKAGSNPFMQQPFNEVLASIIAEALEIPHVRYDLIWDGELPYSVCEDFVTRNTDLVSAWRIMQTQKRSNSTSIYQHYLNCCMALGMTNIEHSLDQMIVLDFLIGNEDRHLNNFGILRDADSLKWIGPAPIYDSGSSFGFDKLTAQILAGTGIECKPFKKSHEEQLKLVSSFDWIKVENLKGIEDTMRPVLDQAKNYLDEARKDAIITAFLARINVLVKVLQKQSPHKQDDLSMDVEENIANNYL